MLKGSGCISGSRGSTLIEILVGTCLLGFCMVMAAAAMRQSSIAMTNNIFQQRAIRLGSDMAEVLRGVSATFVLHDEIPAAHDCVGAVCSAQQFLQAQLSDWLQRAASVLPSGTVAYTTVRTGGTPHVLITVEWRGESGHTYSRRFNVALSQ